MVTRAGQLQLLDLVADGSPVKLVWLSWPCGTGTRVHDAPLSGERRPLRSAREPRGRSDIEMSKEVKTRLEAENTLVDFGLELISHLDARGIGWIIAGADNSFLWHFQGYPDLLGRSDVSDTLHDLCMVGGTRPKRQRLRGTLRLPSLANRFCDGSHAHQPWRAGALPWSAAEYPQQFCDVVVQDILAHWAAQPRGQGGSCPAAGGPAALLRAAISGAAQSRADRRVKAMEKIAAQRQPRQQRPPLVPEYAEILAYELSAQQRATLQSHLDPLSKNVLKHDVHIGDVVFKAGWRILEAERGEGQENPDTITTLAGVYHAPEEFLRQALAAEHPFDLPPGLPDRTLNAIFEVLTKGPHGIGRARSQAIQRWRRRAWELDADEWALFDAAPEPIKACWYGSTGWEGAHRPGHWPRKRTLLWREMLVEAGFPDPDLLVNYIRMGTPVFGEVPRCRAFDAREHVGGKSLGKLLGSAQWARPALRGSLRPCRTPGVDEEVLERTLEEVDEGKALGPFDTEEEVSRVVGDWWVPCRRVGLSQAAGVRPIDDYSEYGHNATSRTHDHIDLGGVDRVAAIAHCLSSSLYHGCVDVWLSTGLRRRGAVHPGHLAGGGASAALVGRPVDLRRAFKQLAPFPSLAPLAVICLWNPKKRKPEYYILRANPFGARNTVFIFGGVARGLDYILAVLFHLVVDQYVDDFPQLEPSSSATSARVTMDSVLDLLGWDVKVQDGTTPEFQDVFAALGVRFDLSGVGRGEIVICHKAGRAEAVIASMRQIEEEGVLRPPVAASLRGTLGYCRSVSFGGCGAHGLKYLTDIAYGAPAPVTEEVREVFAFFKELLMAAKPRTLKVGQARPHVVLFVDGAEEPSCVSCGAVLYDQTEAHLRRVFAVRVKEEAVARWKKEGTKRVIHQAELLPVALAFGVWGALLADMRVLVFVDNDAARAALIKGSSGSMPSARLVHQAWLAASRHGMSPWFERVPSPSNVADAPSRLDLSCLAGFGLIDDSAQVAAACSDVEVPRATTGANDRGVGGERGMRATPGSAEDAEVFHYSADDADAFQ